MPNRRAELRYLNPEMQELVEQRKREMAKHYARGTPGAANTPEQAQYQQRLNAIRQMIGPSAGAQFSDAEKSHLDEKMGMIQEQYRTPEELGQFIRKQPLPRDQQPEEIGWGIIDPHTEELLRRAQDPGERTRMYDPSYLQSLDDNDLEALSEQARTNGEAEDTDDEFTRRGYKSSPLNPSSPIRGQK